MSIVSQFSNGPLYQAELLGGLWRLAGLDAEDVATRYSIFRAYYHGSGLYQDLRELLKQNHATPEALMSLRNPCHAVTEFYAATLWAGTLADSLAIETQNAALLPAIAQVWTWSNWAVRKQTYARNLALLGDQFTKVATHSDRHGTVDRVYFQLLDPGTVTQFDVDERGFLTYIRLDIPQTRRDRDQTTSSTHTEIWDKASGRFRVWQHDWPSATSIAELGPPAVEHDFAAFGVDFIPIVHGQFRDVGEARGANCFAHALEAIDEANRMATRLHQMLYRYNKADMVLASAGRDSEGRSIPPPALLNQGDDTVSLGDETFYTLPAGWDVRHLVAPLNYADALAVLQDHMTTLEHELLPELTYYRISELSGEVSGRAIRFMLSSAIDRVIEARGNAEQALVRLNQMALSIAQAGRLPPFRDIGSYDKGDFGHAFAARDVIPLSALELAQTDLAKAQAAYSKVQAGWSAQQAMREYGLTKEEIGDVERERETGANGLGAALLNQFNAGR